MYTQVVCYTRCAFTYSCSSAPISALKVHKVHIPVYNIMRSVCSNDLLQTIGLHTGDVKSVGVITTDGVMVCEIVYGCFDLHICEYIISIIDTVIGCL